MENDEIVERNFKLMQAYAVMFLADNGQILGWADVQAESMRDAITESIGQVPWSGVAYAFDMNVMPKFTVTSTMETKVERETLEQ